MNQKKDQSEKVRNAGISLEPKLIERVKVYARKTGFGTISNLSRFLLMRELQTRTIELWVAMINFEHVPPSFKRKPEEALKDWNGTPPETGSHAIGKRRGDGTFAFKKGKKAAATPSSSASEPASEPPPSRV